MIHDTTIAIAILGFLFAFSLTLSVGSGLLYRRAIRSCRDELHRTQATLARERRATLSATIKRLEAAGNYPRVTSVDRMETDKIYGDPGTAGLFRTQDALIPRGDAKGNLDELDGYTTRKDQP